MDQPLPLYKFLLYMFLLAGKHYQANENTLFVPSEKKNYIC